MLQVQDEKSSKSDNNKNPSRLKVVVSIKELQNLLNLDLSSNTMVSDIESIKELKKLRTLFISRCNNITDKQLRDLQKDMPQLSIRRDSQPFTYFNPRIE